MFFDKKIDRSLEHTKSKLPDGQLPLSEEELSERMERYDFAAMVLGAFRAFWPIFAVLLLLFLLVYFLF